ncbi:MAG: nucleotidyltransferase family protein [Chloroflexi bacterium]|nr:nucleotidyltransferase family protein [Chloroflexota bacterium]
MNKNFSNPMDGSCSIPADYAAVIMAAGGGTRFHSGSHKLLTRIDGKPILIHTVERVLSAGYRTVIVVLGYQAEALAALLQDIPVEIVLNKNWERGQSTSLQKGVLHLPEGTRSACLVLADQPFVSINTYRALARQQEEQPDKIIMPTYKGETGNPTMFPQLTFAELRSQSAADSGGRRLLKKYETCLLETNDPYVIRDIDTLEDFRKYTEN